MGFGQGLPSEHDSITVHYFARSDDDFAHLFRTAVGGAHGCPPYAVLDRRASFELERNWQVALSVNSVLDKRCYLTVSAPDRREVLTAYIEPLGG